MKDQQHVQKHLKTFNDVALDGHKADMHAAQNEINYKSKSKNQMTHLMSEAIRNKERLANFWQESRDGANKKKGKYGWGFGYVN